MNNFSYLIKEPKTIQVKPNHIKNHKIKHADSHREIMYMQNKA